MRLLVVKFILLVNLVAILDNACSHDCIYFRQENNVTNIAKLNLEKLTILLFRNLANFYCETRFVNEYFYGRINNYSSSYCIFHI